MKEKARAKVRADKVRDKESAQEKCSLYCYTERFCWPTGAESVGEISKQSVAPWIVMQIWRPHFHYCCCCVTDADNEGGVTMRRRTINQFLARRNNAIHAVTVSSTGLPTRSIYTLISICMYVFVRGMYLSVIFWNNIFVAVY